MFGTSKDVNTGNTYMTFLGKEALTARDDVKSVINEVEKLKNAAGQSISMLIFRRQAGAIMGVIIHSLPVVTQRAAVLV